MRKRDAIRNPSPSGVGRFKNRKPMKRGQPLKRSAFKRKACKTPLRQGRLNLGIARRRKDSCGLWRPPSAGPPFFDASRSGAEVRLKTGLTRLI